MTRKHVKARSLKLVSHLASVRPLSTDDRTFFAPFLKNRIDGDVI